jgi:hypothetical protein
MMRKFTRTCAVNTVLGVPILTTVDIGPVDFAVGDSVFVFADNNERDDDDDDWIRAQVTAVLAGTCPQDGSAARLISFTGQGGLFTADSVRVGAPVRSYTTVRFGLTTLYGDVYLGRAEGNAALSPVAGPLRATTGIQFIYRDALGAVTTTPANVRQIVVTVRSGSGVLNSLGQTVSDSITAWVYTRN